MKRFAFACLSLLLWSCSETPTVIPARNLERPSDMVFLCLATQRDTNGTEVLTGQPMQACQPTGACAGATPDNKCPGLSSPRTFGTFAVVTNTSRGELSVVDLDQGRLVDVDPVVPGFGTVPVGNLPESLAASQDGCWVATANRDSCDLALVDPSRVLTPLFNNTTPATGAGSAVTRVHPTTASGRILRAAPREIAFVPSDNSGLLCSSTQAPLALVTFPTCNLVALLDLPSARIVDSYYVQANGVVHAGTEPVCADDCTSASIGGDAAATDELDAASLDGIQGDAGSDGGIGVADTASSVGVGALALSPDGTRVFVGASEQPSIAVFDLAGRSLMDRGRLTLSENARGVDRLRLAVDPFKPRTENGVVVGQGDYLAGSGRFLYAFAHDASVRVVQLDSTMANGIGQECDVNIDHTQANAAILSQTPGISASVDPVTLAVIRPCIPVGTAGLTRRPLATGPGITIPNLSPDDREPPLPRDIAFAEVFQAKDALPAEWLANPQGLTGQFGFLLASNGAVYITNLAPNPEAALLVANGTTNSDTFRVQFVRSQATHGFREGRTQNYAGAKQPSAYAAPLSVQGQTDVLYPTTSPVGPQMDSITVVQNLSTTGNQETEWATFPDPTSPVSHRWNIVWEDLLPGTSRDSGSVVGPVATTAGALVDTGADFCSHSILPGDLATLPGCLVDTDCVPQSKFVCRRLPGGVRGTCLPADDAVGNSLLDKCARFLASRRRYEIQQATPTQLTLGLKLDEVPRPSTAPCTPGAGFEHDCQPTSAHQANSSKKFPDGSTDPGFQCLPVNGQNRCVKSCALPGTQAGDAFCRLGHVCENVPGSAVPLCVEAPPIEPACWPQPSVTYNVHAGRSFLVTGTELPRVSTTKEVAGQCVPDASRPVDRISLTAPRCTTFTDNQTTPQLVVTNPFAPDPCLFTTETHTKAVFQNSQIRFVLTDVDQYAGDGLAFRLDVVEGVSPATVIIPSFDIMLSQGVRIVVGPTRAPESLFLRGDFPSLVNQTPSLAQNPYLTQYPYLFVVDQGRTVVTPARGQILRINPRRAADGYAAFSPATTGDYPFQIQ